MLRYAPALSPVRTHPPLVLLLAVVVFGLWERGTILFNITTSDRRPFPAANQPRTALLRQQLTTPVQSSSKAPNMTPRRIAAAQHCTLFHCTF